MNIERASTLSEKDWSQIDRIDDTIQHEHEIEETDLFLLHRLNNMIAGYIKRDITGHIHALFISSDFRCQRIGSGLLAECMHISLSEGCANLSAGVKNDNSPALEFFKENGFNQKQTGNNYVMFTKRLS